MLPKLRFSQISAAFLLILANVQAVAFDMSIALADEKSRVDEVYNSYILAGKPDRAYEYLLGAADSESLLYLGYHLMTGYGVRRDICGATKYFESILNKSRMRSLSALNILYNSSWISIAALEGNKDASFELDLYYKNQPIDARLPQFGGIESIDRLAFIHLSRAVRFGESEALREIDDLLARNHDLKDIEVDYSKQKVICDPR
jgi:TPR repeat protein